MSSPNLQMLESCKWTKLHWAPSPLIPLLWTENLKKPLEIFLSSYSNKWAIKSFSISLCRKFISFHPYISWCHTTFSYSFQTRPLHFDVYFVSFSENVYICYGKIGKKKAKNLRKFYCFSHVFYFAWKLFLSVFATGMSLARYASHPSHPPVRHLYLYVFNQWCVLYSLTCLFTITDAIQASNVWSVRKRFGCAKILNF